MQTPRVDDGAAAPVPLLNLASLNSAAAKRAKAGVAKQQQQPKPRSEPQQLQQPQQSQQRQQPQQQQETQMGANVLSPDAARRLLRGLTPQLGMSFAEVEFADDEDVQGGMEVTNLTPGQPAAAAGLALRDIIVRVNGHLTPTRERFFQLWTKVKAGDLLLVEMLRSSGGGTSDDSGVMELLEAELLVGACDYSMAEIRTLRKVVGRRRSVDASASASAPAPASSISMPTSDAVWPAKPRLVAASTRQRTQPQGQQDEQLQAREPTALAPLVTSSGRHAHGDQQEHNQQQTPQQVVHIKASVELMHTRGSSPLELSPSGSDFVEASKQETRRQRSMERQVARSRSASRSASRPQSVRHATGNGTTDESRRQEQPAGEQADRTQQQVWAVRREAQIQRGRGFPASARASDAARRDRPWIGAPQSARSGGHAGRHGNGVLGRESADSTNGQGTTGDPRAFFVQPKHQQHNHHLTRDQSQSRSQSQSQSQNQNQNQLLDSELVKAAAVLSVARAQQEDENASRRLSRDRGYDQPTESTQRRELLVRHERQEREAAEEKERAANMHQEEGEEASEGENVGTARGWDKRPAQQSQQSQQQLQASHSARLSYQSPHEPAASFEQHAARPNGAAQPPAAKLSASTRKSSSSASARKNSWADRAHEPMMAADVALLPSVRLTRTDLLRIEYNKRRDKELARERKRRDKRVKVSSSQQQQQMGFGSRARAFTLVLLVLVVLLTLVVVDNLTLCFPPGGPFCRGRPCWAQSCIRRGFPHTRAKQDRCRRCECCCWCGQGWSRPCRMVFKQLRRTYTSRAAT